MNFKIAIPTHWRADIIKQKTLSLIKDLWAEITIFANPCWEKGKYYQFLWKEFNIVEIPTFTTMGKLRNDILDYYNEWDKILMLDDDVSKIYKLCFKNGKPNKEEISTNEFLELIEQWFGMCESIWYKLRGVNSSQNPLCMKNVIKYDKFIDWTFLWIIKSKLRFDDQINNKEDYDFTIQNVKAYWGAIRFDRICTDNKYLATKWGLQNSPRTQEKDIVRLDMKWGKIIKRNPKKAEEIFIRL